MTDIQGNSAVLAALGNPSNTPAAAAPTAVSPPATRKRIPLSVPRRKLEVDAIPGYVLYWFLQPNVPAAIDAGYEAVNNREVRLNQSNVAGNADDSGNTDLGSGVSVIGNKLGDNNQPERLILMKIREEWWQEDRQSLDEASANVINSIFGPGHVSAPEATDELTYSRTAQMQGSGRLFNKGLKKVIQKRS